MKLDKLAKAVRPGLGDRITLRELSNGWSAVSAAHRVHLRHKQDIIFPMLERFFPGQVRSSKRLFDIEGKDSDK